MIFVTVGTEQYAFNRMMHWIDLLLNNQIIQEEVLVQYGSSTYLPTGVKVFKTLKESSFLEKIHQSRLVISHCGEGTVLLLDTLKKPYILVPRSYAYREHVDNHQVEMALALSAESVPVAWSPGDLLRFVDNPKHTNIPDISKAAAIAVCESLSQRFGHIS